MTTDAPVLSLRRVSPWWLRPDAGAGEALLEARALPGGGFRVTLPGVEGGSGEGDTPHEAASAAARAAGREPAPVPPAPADGGPAWHEGLGWCTWDAFYQDVTEANVVAGLTAWRDSGIVPSTLILDDGWHDVRRFNEVEQAPGVVVNAVLRGFDADPGKVPGGLAPLIRRIKAEFGVKRVGAWHTLMGYWCGVDPDGPLAAEYGVRAVEARPIGMPTLPSVKERGAVPALEVGRFFSDWHGFLRGAGVDFVKVDNGGSLPELCSEEDEPGFVAAYHAALRASAAEHFGPGGLLPCMSMVTPAADAPDPGRAVFASRNSDDFFPTRPASHRQHIRDNAANALWTAGFARPDWDMFHSRHPWASYHAAARAVCGGPVYVSDKVGESDPVLLRRLLDGDGRTLRFDGPAEPVALDGLWTVVRNRHRRGGYAAETTGFFSAEEAAVSHRVEEGDGDFRVDDSTHEWTLLHRVGPQNGLRVFGWDDALCPPVTVLSCEPDGEGLRVELRPPATPDARLLVGVEGTGEVHRLGAGTAASLRLVDGAPVAAG